MEDKFMDLAMKEALKAYKKGNTPVGAVIVKDNKVIAKAHNQKNTSNIAVDHAEILVIRKTCKKLNSWRLNDCTMYVTLEPCQMCYGAIKEARISKVVYILKSKYNELMENSDNLVIKTYKTDSEYLKILKGFFKEIR